MSRISHAIDRTGEGRDNIALASKISEGRLSLVNGLFTFVLALTNLANADLIGWVMTVSVWATPTGALVPTYIALLAPGATAVAS